MERHHIDSSFYEGWLKGRGRITAVALLLLFTSATIFSLWFKFSQLILISPDLPKVYPIFYWLPPVVFAACFFTILWLGWGLLFKPLFLPDDWHLFCLLDAIGFTSFILAPLGVPIKICTLTFLSAKLLIVAFFIFKHKIQWGVSLQRHLAVFILIVVFCSVFSGFISPVFWDNPMGNYPLSGTGRILANTTPLYKSAYVNAEQFSFSFMDHAYWAGIARYPTDMFSVVIPVLAFAFGLSAVDVESFHRLMLIVNFNLLVAGSFTFYLFLFVGLRLSFAASLFGGLAIVFTNQTMIRQMAFDYPINTSLFLCIPLALLFIRLAFRENRLAWAAMSGLILALPFYILAPHPEVTMKGIFFFGFYLAYMVFFNREQADAMIRIRLGAICLLAALSGATYYLIPVFAPIMIGELEISISARPLFTYGLRDTAVVLSPFLTSCGILSCLALTEVKNIWSHRSLRSDFVFFGGMLLFLLLLLIPGNSGIFNGLFTTLLPSIKFYAVERTSLYLVFASVTVAAMALDTLSRSDMKHHASIIFISLCISCAVATFFIPQDIAKHTVLDQFGNADVVSSQPGFLFPYYFRHYGTDGISIVRPFIILMLSLLFAFVCWFPAQLIAYMKPAIFRSSRTSYFNIIRVFLLAAVFIVITVVLTEPLQSGTPVIYSKYLPDYRPTPAHYNTNPYYAGLHPYISFQAVLANAKGISGSNSRKYIQYLLLQFEQEAMSLKLSLNDARIASYYLALKQKKANSASDISLEDIAAFGEVVCSVVDAFYLEHLQTKYMPLFPSRKPPISWVGDHNVAAIFSGLDQPLYRIMALSADEKSGLINCGGNPLLGVGEGILINNSTVTLDGRSTLTYPPVLTFIMIEATSKELPDSSPWAVRAELLSFEALRKLMNISGIDVYVLPRSKWPGVEDKTDLQPVETNVHNKIDPDFVVVKDTRSFGLSYLVNTAIYWPLFQFPVNDFLNNSLGIRLASSLIETLRYRFDAVIEDERRNFGERELAQHDGANSLRVLNFIGDIAAFEVENRISPCKQVLNLAAINGWKAFADDQPLTIRRANAAFMSVDVPPGKHLIWFEHRANSILLGISITLLSFIAVLVSLRNVHRE